MRTPISLVRLATPYDVVPYRPTHAIASASKAKAVHSRAKVTSWLILTTGEA